MSGIRTITDNKLKAISNEPSELSALPRLPEDPVARLAIENGPVKDYRCPDCTVDTLWDPFCSTCRGYRCIRVGDRDWEEDGPDPDLVTT